MSKEKLKKMDEERRMKARADALRRQDEKYNESIRQKYNQLKEEGKEPNWNVNDKLKDAKKSIKKATENKGLFQKLIKRLKD